MAYPSEQWTLMKLCREANVPRGVARAAVRRRLIASDGYQRDDVPALKLAAVLLDTSRSDGDEDRVTTRNRNAIALVRGLANDPAPTRHQVMVLTSDAAMLCSDGQAMADALRRADGEAVTCVPVGRWVDDMWDFTLSA
jgi:hypothetical protein